jgi:hypothetical protein
MILTSGILPAMATENSSETDNKPFPSFNIDQTTPTARNFIKSNANINIPQNTVKDDIVSIRFSWNNPVNMATFTRNNKIWVIFDHQNKFDIDTLKADAKHMAKEIYTLPHPSGAIVIIEPNDGVKHSLRKEGLLWILDLYTGKPPKFKIENYTIFNQFDSLKNSYLYIPTPSAGNILSFIDPEIGDIITVSTTSKLGQGIKTPYRYPDFDILQSSQGFALILNASDIVLNRGNSGLTLKAMGRGLNITNNLDALKRNQQNLHTEILLNKEFDLQIPENLRKMSLEKVTENFKKQIIAAPLSKKNALRIKLAQYYVHNGLGSEALYIINQMKKLNIPEIKNDHFYALSGIANFLARRYDEAIDDFSQKNIPNTEDGVFWRTISKSAKEFTEENNAIILAHISLMKDYPQPIKDQISIVAAKNAIETGDDLSSQNFIDILNSSPERIRNLDPEITYLNSQKLEMQGYMRNAMKQYKKLINSDSAMFSAYARLRYTVIGEILKFINLKDAIAELEKLRFAWGEKSFKINVLKQLAKLYLKNNDYYNALRILNDAGFFVDEKQKTSIARQMVKIFEDIFISNHADTALSPVKALALFQDFKWLAPLSSKHHLIVQKLADRLVAIDLLSRAQELLLTLLYKNDLSEEDQAKVGARIAIIYLFEGNAEEALKAIEATAYPNIPEALKNQRNIIASKALSTMGQTNEALDLIKNDTSSRAILRKFEIYQNAQDWDNASNTIKQLIEEPVEGTPLSSQQINYILDWATTLKQAGKETVLIRLKNKFDSFFKNTPYYSTFNILTNHLEEDKIDIGSIKTVISDIKNFNEFARFYTEKLEHEKPQNTETKND